jgi:hypothetical protein
METTGTEPGRRKTTVIATVVTAGFALIAAVAFGILWRQQVVHERKAVAAVRARLHATVEDAARRAADARFAGYTAGSADGAAVENDRIFVDGWTTPFRAGQWYLVKMSPKGPAGGFAAAYDVTSDSGEAWAIEGGKPYTYNVGSRVGQGSVNSNPTVGGCQAGGIRLHLILGVACTDAASAYYSFVSGSVSSAWYCTGGASSGTCRSDSGLSADASRSFSWPA